MRTSGEFVYEDASSSSIKYIADLPLDVDKIFGLSFHGKLPRRFGSRQAAPAANRLQILQDLRCRPQEVTFIRRRIGTEQNFKSFHGVSISQKPENVKTKYLMINIGFSYDNMLYPCLN